MASADPINTVGGQLTAVSEISSPATPDVRRRRPRRRFSCSRCLTSTVSSSVFVGILFVAYIFGGAFLFKVRSPEHSFLLKIRSPDHRFSLKLRSGLRICVHQSVFCLVYSYRFTRGSLKYIRPTLSTLLPKSNKIKTFCRGKESGANCMAQSGLTNAVDM